MRGIIIGIGLLAILGGCNSSFESKFDLAGTWVFQMDPEDRGVEEKWFNSELKETILLPGSMTENGKGYDVTLNTEFTGFGKHTEWITDPNYAPYHDPKNIRFPFLLQPEKTYTGAAWYQKKVILPENWQGKTTHMILERPHWESMVWINGEQLGMQNSLATPHIFDISSFIKKGENYITVRIDNRIKEINMGASAHSVTDHTQTNWNGMVGEISLQATAKIYFENTEVFPDIKNKTVRIRTSVSNNLKEQKNIEIIANARLKSSGKNSRKKSWKFTLSPGQNKIEMDFEIGDDALLWDEFNPNVYELRMLMRSDQMRDEQVIDFGLREFKADGTRFSINGRPVFLRGTLECAIFPITGYPPTNVEGWEKVFNALKAHGLNHMRFHSWCPPEAAFEAADAMGIYLQVECSAWTSIGSGQAIDQYILDESKHIVKAYGNHPSFVMMAYGNEPGGPKSKEFLTDFVTFWKKTDKRRVYTCAAGWPILPVNDYHNMIQPRIQGWGEGLNSIINAEPPQTAYDWSNAEPMQTADDWGWRGRLPDDGKPVVSHEVGQWCAYPNFKEMEKYTGVLKPKNFELFQESLNAHHLGHLADSFLMASGKLQALCYKADIEAALRTPDFGGFQLLDLHDFPGQGTALVGVLDPFWEEKGYISPKEFRRFCNTTVPLARLEKRIFMEGETIAAPIEIAHFGEEPLVDVNPVWKIWENEQLVSEGSLGKQDIPIGNAISLGELIQTFQKKNHPRKLSLEVTVSEFSNSWDIWVYPEYPDLETNEIKVVEKLDASTMQFLNDGGKVLLSLGKGKVASEMGGDIGVGFSSIFWNTTHTNRQKPHTLGILCDPLHPALGKFPTEFHSNWQWWDAMSHADAIELDSFPTELHPIVRIIDDWISNRRLALLFEAKTGNGSILISGVDLVHNLENRPEARQLLYSLETYMTGAHFNPRVDLSIENINTLIK